MSALPLGEERGQEMSEFVWRHNWMTLKFLHQINFLVYSYTVLCKYWKTFSRVSMRLSFPIIFVNCFCLQYELMTEFIFQYQACQLFKYCFNIKRDRYSNVGVLEAKNISNSWMSTRYQTTWIPTTLMCTVIHNWLPGQLILIIVLVCLHEYFSFYYVCLFNATSPVHNRRMLSARNARMSSVELPDENEKSVSSASTSPCHSPVSSEHTACKFM